MSRPYLSTTLPLSCAQAHFASQLSAPFVAQNLPCKTRQAWLQSCRLKLRASEEDVKGIISIGLEAGFGVTCCCKLTLSACRPSDRHPRADCRQDAVANSRATSLSGETYWRILVTLSPAATVCSSDCLLLAQSTARLSGRRSHVAARDGRRSLVSAARVVAS